jgi:hypothetical protein
MRRIVGVSLASYNAQEYEIFGGVELLHALRRDAAASGTVVRD